MFHLDPPLSQGTTHTDSFTPTRLDLYPANATYTDADDTATTVANVRIIFTLDTAYAWRDARLQGDPELIFQQRFTDAYATDPAYIAEFDDGSVLSVTRSTGCGCGSRLRGFRVFSGGISHDRNLEKRAQTP